MTDKKINKNNLTPEKNKKLEQHPFLMLSIILAIVCISANFIPSGTYERIAFEGRTIVDPTTYKTVEKQYINIEDFFLSFYHGFQKASGLIAMVLFVGGAFGVVKRIGLMETAIKAMAYKLKNVHFIPMTLTIMVLFGLLVSFTGMWELSLVVLPLIIPLYLKLGFDVMVGTSVVLVAAASGFGAAATNPFFTAIAHKIAELPIYSGLGYRMLTFFLLLSIGLGYITIYAKKVKANPNKSLLIGIKANYSHLDDSDYHFSPALIRAGLVFIGLFAFLIYGTVYQGFSFAQMSATFVAIGILVGLAYGSKPNEICHMFAKGMGDLMIAALVIFFARSILYIMEQTQVIDTIIYTLAGLTEGASGSLMASLIYVVQTIINFLIPSGSGQAAITMPIMVPLADVNEINRQVAVYASQLGDGLSNFIYPTNGALIAVLSVAGIPYKKWITFFGPLFLIFAAVSTLMIIAAQNFNYGPF